MKEIKMFKDLLDLMIKYNIQLESHQLVVF